MTLALSKMAIETPKQQRHVVDLEERTWLARHCRGDLSAFPALMEAYRRPVYSYLVRSGVVQADRDDVFQSIFLKIHSAANAYDPARPLAPWLFTIVANTVRNHLRDRPIPFSPAPGDDPPDDDPPEVPDPNPGPEHITTVRETLGWLEQALLALPPMQREVLLLISVVGLRQQDVALSLKLPLNTVKTHLRRARLTLAAGLAERNAPRNDTGDSHD